MHAVLALTPLHDALAELELAAALVILAEQEGQAIAEALPRLRRALATVGRCVTWRPSWPRSRSMEWTSASWLRW